MVAQKVILALVEEMKISRWLFLGSCTNNSAEVAVILVGMTITICQKIDYGYQYYDGFSLLNQEI